MSREEIQNLLAGYATGTLGEAERRALFDAALDDQELFDWLAKEDALREVLDDPAARQQLIGALGPTRQKFGERAWRWLRQPAVLAVAGALAVLLIGAGIVLRQSMHPKRAAIMAEALPPPPPAAVPSPAPQAKAAPAEHTERRLAGRLRGGNERPSPPGSQMPPPSPAQAPPAAAAGMGVASGAGGVSTVPPAPSPSPPTETAQAGAPVTSPPAPPPPVPTPPSATRALGFAGTATQRGRAFGGALPRAKKLGLPAMAGRRAIGYHLLLEGADGTYAPAPSGAAFRAGDSVRLRVAPDEDGYLYLFQRSQTGWDLIASQRVERGQSYDLPSTGGLQAVGAGPLELVLTPQEQSGLAAGQNPEVDVLASMPGARFESIALGGGSAPAAQGTHATPAKPAAPPKQP